MGAVNTYPVLVGLFSSSNDYGGVDDSSNINLKTALDGPADELAEYSEDLLEVTDDTTGRVKGPNLMICHG